MEVALFSPIANKIHSLFVFCSAALLLTACVGGGGGEGAAGPLGGPVGGPVQQANPEGTVGSAIESMDIEPTFPCPDEGCDKIKDSSADPVQALGLDASHPYGILKDGTQPISCKEDRDLFTWELSFNNNNISGKVISYDGQTLPAPQLAILRLHNLALEGNPCEYPDVADQLESQEPLLGTLSYFNLDDGGNFQGELPGDENDVFVAIFNLNNPGYFPGDYSGDSLGDILMGNPWVAVFKIHIREIRTPTPGVAPPDGFRPTPE